MTSLIKHEQSFLFVDNTKMDVGINIDGKNIVLIVYKSDCDDQIRVNLKAAEANKLIAVMRSKVQQLD